MQKQRKNYSREELEHQEGEFEQRHRDPHNLGSGMGKMNTV